MRNTMFNLPWARVFTVETKRMFVDPIFAGSPQKYAEALKVRYGTWGAVAGFISAMKLVPGNPQDDFFTQTMNYVHNRAAGRSRRTRNPANLPITPVQA